MSKSQAVWPIIVTRQARDFLSDDSPAFLSFLRKWEGDPSSIRRFPDGSLHVDGDLATTELHVLVAPFRGRFLDVNAVFRSLAPFPRRLYTLYSRGVPGAPVGDVVFVVAPVAVSAELPGENRLEDLSVAVGFRRRASKQGMRRFVSALAEWASSVSERGIFGDGPAKFACPDVEFRGLRATFRVDASRSRTP